jgi:hypothetical protein
MTQTKYNILGLGIIVTLPYSVKEILQSLFARFDDGVMNEFLSNPRFQTYRSMVTLEKLSKFWLRIFKGHMVKRGAYKIYLANRDEFNNARGEK